MVSSPWRYRCWINRAGSSPRSTARAIPVGSTRRSWWVNGGPVFSPGPKFDESKPLPLPCLAESVEMNDAWYVHILRNPERKPDQPARFAEGPFVARVGVWVTFAGEGQQLVTVLVGSTYDRA